MSEKTCIYCDQEPTADNPLTLEHIWPEALGGEYLPDIFQSDRVCRQCNSTCGLFVDGAFIKSPFGAIERSTGGSDYIDFSPKSKSIVPLHYIGRADDLPRKLGDVVEVWLGPCGTNILHFWSDQSKNDWTTYAGGRPARQKREDRVYVSLCTANNTWIAITLRSILSHFRKARVFAMNFTINGVDAHRFEQPPLNHPDFIEDLAGVEAFQSAAKKGNSVRGRVVVDINFERRWLCKIALGVGQKLLGDEYLKTSYRLALKEVLWRKDPEVDDSTLLRGAGYWSEKRDLEVLKWPGAWVISIISANDGLSLNITTPSGKSMTIVICDDLSLICIGRKIAIFENIYLAIPSLGVGIGPLTLEEYVLHKSGNRRLPALTKVEERRVERHGFPSC
jgi:hypothetical protein